MSRIKIISLLIAICLVFTGCATVDVNVDEDKVDINVDTVENKEKKTKPDTETEEPKEEEKTEKPEEKAPKKFADSPATAGLKAYAEGISTLYSSEFNVVFNEVKFMLEDFSGDGQPELLAVGIHDGAMSYMEVFAYIDGKVSGIYDGQIGGANGRNAYPVRYKGVPYIMNESISSANGFYQQLMQYNGKEWHTVHSSFVEFDFYNNGEKKGCIVNDAPASDETYENVRNEVEKGYMKLSEFVSAKSL